MQDMTKHRLPYLNRSVNRVGAVYWYVRRRHGARIPIPGEYGSKEFLDAYHDAVAGIATVRPETRASKGTLLWLVNAWKLSSDWAQTSPATRKLRDNILARVLEDNGGCAVEDIDAAAIRAGRERRQATPAAANGKSPAIRGYVAQSVSEATQAQVMEALDQSLPKESADPLTRTIASLLRELLSATLKSGGIDAAVAVDTTTSSEQAPLPAITAGVRVKDGAALEQRVKKMFGPQAGLPAGVSVKFDSGKAGPANLHTIAVELGDSPVAKQLGKSLDLTLAVADEYAFVLVGGDLQQRITAALAASGRADPEAKPIANVQVALNRVLGYAADRGAGPQVLAAAERADTADSSLLQLFVRPIDRGLVTRLSADAGVLKAVATLSGAPAAPAGPAGVPLPQLPPGFPIPGSVPLPR
jgi:hypothetical protein